MKSLVLEFVCIWIAGGRIKAPHGYLYRMAKRPTRPGKVVDVFLPAKALIAATRERLLKKR